jgi:hypothetical protein
MTSLCNELLEPLPPGMREQALKLGVRARLADDDIAWVLVVAAVRLDLAMLTDIAVHQTREKADKLSESVIKSAVTELSKHTAQAISRAIADAGTGAVARQRNHSVALNLAAFLAFVALLVGAAWAGAQGYTLIMDRELQERRSQLAALEELEAKSRPPWLTWWGRKESGERVVFLSSPTESVTKEFCIRGEEKGTCITVD